jgi:hypothetical protein
MWARVFIAFTWLWTLQREIPVADAEGASN